MYLILPAAEAHGRNNQEATKRGWKVPNAKYWSWQISVDETMCALDVGNGDGLTDDELVQCVETLPESFITIVE